MKEEIKGKEKKRKGEEEKRKGTRRRRRRKNNSRLIYSINLTYRYLEILMPMCLLTRSNFK